MNMMQSAGVPRIVRAAGHALVLGLAGVSAQAMAATDVQVWHTLSPANKDQLEKIVKQFNRDQKDVRVVLKGFDSQANLRDAATRAVAAKKGPHLVQIEDNHSPDVIAEHKSILPLYRLLDDYPIKDLGWFLPQTSSFVRDNRGRLLAFPWMAEIPVMFYNLDAYKKAGLDPKAPSRTWNDLQADLLKLRDNTDLNCPYATSQQVSVHLENLAPMNNRLYTSANNGLDKGTPKFNFDSLYMRHLSLMVSWKRSLLLTEHTDDDRADALFAKGQCGVLTAGSGALGSILAGKVPFGVTPLPYYSQVAKQPGRPFVSGSALWAVAGHPRDEDKATMAFLAYLAKPVVAAQWHQNTGFLPLTDAAFRAADVSFYNRIPGAQAVVESVRATPAASARGFRLANYPQVEQIFNAELQTALSGDVPPMRALNVASEKAEAAMRR
ncbi:Glycerol-3-phosphate ABC transporter, periplasmic glycerol-3-phosphate-binding protein (TC 3.A.1.1.3) [plant metagenome]|uniref:Glycerol-3-phosphate ABC transporter, periplasmic glycerol-3-phosphate-binding protein (TC 3.A.1.1.3) n=1 Tax=plant metagenome TaxID=1297885 RepID=A0A484SCM0_9ZZZZ